VRSGIRRRKQRGGNSIPEFYSPSTQGREKRKKKRTFISQLCKREIN